MGYDEAQPFLLSFWSMGSLARLCHIAQYKQYRDPKKYCILLKISSIQPANILWGRYYLYYALRSTFGALILFILCTKQIFGGTVTVLLILCTTQYFQEVDTIFTMYNAVFSKGRYYLYYALSIFWGGRLQYYLYYALRSIFRRWILFLLCTTKCSRRVDTIYTMH